MPTIAVDKAALFEALGQEWVHCPNYGCLLRLVCLMKTRFTTEEFDELCFEFGMHHSTLRPERLY